MKPVFALVVFPRVSLILGPSLPFGQDAGYFCWGYFLELRQGFLTLILTFFLAYSYGFLINCCYDDSIRMEQFALHAVGTNNMMLDMKVTTPE
jgi:hypothetical protein